MLDREGECEIPYKAITDFKMQLILTAIFLSGMMTTWVIRQYIVYNSVLKHLPVKLPYNKEHHQQITPCIHRRFPDEGQLLHKSQLFKVSITVANTKYSKTRD